MLSNSSNTFNPRDKKTWHFKYEQRDGPVIFPVRVNGEDAWQCYCKADNISAVAYDPDTAYHLWEQKVIEVEKEFL